MLFLYDDDAMAISTPMPNSTTISGYAKLGINTCLNNLIVFVYSSAAQKYTYIAIILVYLLCGLAGADLGFSEEGVSGCNVNN